MFMAINCPSQCCCLGGSVTPTCQPRPDLASVAGVMILAPVSVSLSIDTSLALRTAASRLADEFTGTFGTETIERFLHSSYDQLAQQAAITKFLPLMAERFAPQQLSAVARVEGLHRDGKSTVLFLCTHNPAAITAMTERGIDLSNEFPKPWTDETVRAADVVITMGCGDVPAPSSPANATNPGTTSTTPPVSTPLASAPYATTSNAASDN
jgi:hypothetical protein